MSFFWEIYAEINSFIFHYYMVVLKKQGLVLFCPAIIEEAECSTYIIFFCSKESSACFTLLSYYPLESVNLGSASITSLVDIIFFTNLLCWGEQSKSCSAIIATSTGIYAEFLGINLMQHCFRFGLPSQT